MENSFYVVQTSGIGSHNRRGKKAGLWDYVRRWSAPLPCRAVCWAMAECLTAAEPYRRMGTGPGAFGWSPATHGAMMAGRQPPFPQIRLTLWLEHWEKLKHSTVTAPQEESDGQAILWWWVLHKKTETQELWLSNLMTVPDAEITRKTPWPALAKVAVIVRNPVWILLSDLFPQQPPPMKAWFLETLIYKTRPSSAISTAYQHLETSPSQPLSPSDLWIAWAPLNKMCLFAGFYIWWKGPWYLHHFVLFYFRVGLLFFWLYLQIPASYP